MPNFNIGDKIRITKDCTSDFYFVGEEGVIISLTNDSDVPEVEVEFDDGYPHIENSTWWVLVDDLEVLVEKRE